LRKRSPHVPLPASGYREVDREDDGLEAGLDHAGEQIGREGPIA
jgi:hypothetical protein